MSGYQLDYPAALTNKAWQKGKGTIAKMAVGKTDVGAALTALEAEYAKSNFGKVTPFGGVDPLDFAAHEKGALTGLVKSAAELKAKIKRASTTALGAYGEFQASKTVPKSSTQYVKSVITALDDFEKKVDAYPKQAATQLRTDFRAAIKKASAYGHVHDTALKADKKWADLMACIKKVEANPTVEEFKTVFHGDNPARLFTTMCKLWDQVLVGQMPKLAASIYAGKAMTDYFKLPCMSDVANESDSRGSKAIEKLIAASGKDEARVVKTYLLQLSSSAMKMREMIKFCKDADAVIQGV